MKDTVPVCVRLSREAYEALQREAETLRVGMKGRVPLGELLSVLITHSEQNDAWEDVRLEVQDNRDALAAQRRLSDRNRKRESRR